MSKAVGILEKVPEESKVSATRLKWWRRLTQSVWLLILGQWSYYGIFRCPFIVPYVSCSNCPVITCHGRIFQLFWGFWLILPVSVLLFGRAFCGWACPGGFVSQLAGLISPVKMRFKSFFTSIAAYGKYLVLASALYVWLVMGQPREAIPIRIGDFFNSTLLTLEHAGDFWILRTSIIVFFLIASLFAANIWCRFLCPTGGLLEIFKPFSVFKIFKTEQCNNCDKCLRVCEMGTRPAEKNCTNCGDCLDSCPVDAIKLGRNKG